MIHGDLKGVRGCSRSRFTGVLTPGQSQILVDATGHAQITDFGLATVTQNLDAIRNISSEHKYSVQWIAPEILDDRGTYSKETDIFSFAMVMIEVRCSKPTWGRHVTSG